MFDKTQTYCFGRYLVDIPLDAELKGQGNLYQGARITTEKIGPQVLQARIDKKRDALKQGTYAASYYQFKREIKLENNGTILLGYDDPFNTPMYSIDSFKWERGMAFITSQGAYDDKTIDATVGRYSSYLRSLRYRAPRDIPTEPGFCINNGFIASDGKTSQVEKANLAFRVKNNQDVRIRIETEVRFRPWPSLLERQKKARLDERFPGLIKTIRSGELTVNGLTGEESLTSFPSDDKTGDAHNFTWETLGEESNPLKPDIVLAITSGEGVAGVTGPSSMDTRQIQALYETIVKSIRLRPTGGQ
ncbi:MAG: hypothetical protein JO171_17155 [Paludibacterium sp.]|uniref:T6SS immunity protein Tli4 family protein n=1 Tax=Paludibacterium sp. TaxID=1917523 RepID=UPI0025F30BA8|nr:T6SS immunity protein Tli4 family protein [Paludibacterium sp.]MBV8048880.1 hypothetical protein [Paludibacterium sp.]